MAIAAWNMMGGRLDWAALDILAEMVCVDDIEIWLVGLMTIRDRADGK